MPALCHPIKLFFNIVRVLCGNANETKYHRSLFTQVSENKRKSLLLHGIKRVNCPLMFGVILLWILLQTSNRVARKASIFMYPSYVCSNGPQEFQRLDVFECSYHPIANRRTNASAGGACILKRGRGKCSLGTPLSYSQFCKRSMNTSEKKTIS